jgi:mRNA interferase RelE/StbE
VYNVVVHKGPKKTLLRMQEKEFKRISDIIKSLATNPRPYSAIPLTSKKLGDYRIRIGDWRIRYDIDDRKRQVIILDVSRRDKAYK